jgi:hypothetical protein
VDHREEIVEMNECEWKIKENCFGGKRRRNQEERKKERKKRKLCVCVRARGCNVMELFSSFQIHALTLVFIN